MVLQIQIKHLYITPQKSTYVRYMVVSHTAKPCILVLPALGVPAAYYDRLLKSLAKEGWPAAVIDFQGQGKSSVVASRKLNFGYHELLTEDIPAAITQVTSVFNRKVILLGHSLGGQLGSLYFGTQDNRLAGLILCTCCSVYYKLWAGWNKAKVLAGSQLARIYAKLAGYFPGKQFNFGDRTGERLINDWGHQALTGNYKIPGSTVNWEAGLKSITLPVLALHLQSDFLAPPAAVHHLCSKLNNAVLTARCFEGSGLNHLPGPGIPNYLYGK